MNEIEKIVKVAEDLLKGRESVALSAIDASGYPRIYEMEVMTNSNVKTLYFTTGIYSDKVANYKKNEKAGISFCEGEHCISIIGTITVIDHPEEKRRLWSTERTSYLNHSSKGELYCVLQFSSETLYYYLDEEKGFFKFDDIFI